MAEEYVHYTGLATTREITRQQWAAAGVEGQESTYWRKQEGRKLPVSQFNEDALELLRGLPDFDVPDTSDDEEE